MSYVRTLNTTYEEVGMDQLKTHPANPRRGDLEVIKQSISTNGFYGSVVVNKRTSHILAGNHRYLAAKDLGYDTVPVTWVDVGEHEEKRILAADNRTSELGSYDDTILTDLLKELDDEDMLEGTGYTDGDLESLIEELELQESEESESPEAKTQIADELREKWGTERGQIWKVGEHRLMCGDSSDDSDMASLMGNQNPDWVFADPPFDIKSLESLDEVLSLSTMGSFLVAPDRLMGRYLKVTSLELSMFFVWLVRLDLRLGGSDCYTGHLLCGRLSKPGKTARANLNTGGFTTTMDSKYRNRLQESELHPHAKEVESVALIIKNHGSVGDAVLDPFSGSGTTAVACQKSGRVCYGMELNPSYLAVQLERLSEMGLTPELVEKVAHEEKSNKTNK